MTNPRVTGEYVLSSEDCYYMIHPYRDNPERNLKEVMCYARGIIHFTGGLILVPHLMLQYLNEETQRSMIMIQCLKTVRKSDHVVVCGDTISNGMKQEITMADNLNKQIWHMPNPHALTIPTFALVEQWLR